MHANILETIPGQSPSDTIQPAAHGAGRVDLYAGIHKALRLFMSRTLCEVGSTDPDSLDEVRASLDMLDRLLSVSEQHFKDEDEFLHPALHRARPGSAARIAAEHQHHAEAIADLRDLAGLVAAARDATRAVALDRLYRALALFLADNLQHMDYEQTAHNAVLWAHYSDAQLKEIEHALVTSIPSSLMFEALHWFMPALHARERAAMLADMRRGMPPEAFAAVLDIAQRTLSTPEHAKLRQALDLPVSAVG